MRKDIGLPRCDHEQLSETSAPALPLDRPNDSELCTYLLPTANLLTSYFGKRQLSLPFLMHPGELGNTFVPSSDPAYPHSTESSRRYTSPRT